MSRGLARRQRRQARPSVAAAADCRSERSTAAARGTRSTCRAATEQHDAAGRERKRGRRAHIYRLRTRNTRRAHHISPHATQNAFDRARLAENSQRVLRALSDLRRHCYVICGRQASTEVGSVGQRYRLFHGCVSVPPYWAVILVLLYLEPLRTACPSRHWF